MSVFIAHPIVVKLLLSFGSLMWIAMICSNKGNRNKAEPPRSFFSGFFAPSCDVRQPKVQSNRVKKALLERRIKMLQEENKKNRDSFHFITDPIDEIEIRGNLLGQQKVMMKIVNVSTSAQAFKIKCTSNELFRINPVVGILDSEASATISIKYKCYQNEIPGSEPLHFTIYHIPAPEGSYPEGVWQEHYGPAVGEKRIPVTFFHQS
uniref:Major sperm protein n=1 Tax=Ditylenchus dipsaci TaxID=166011 RepID=A0A915DWU2_9BILA